MINGGEGPWQVEKNLVIQATSSQPTCNFIVAIVGSFCVCFQHSTTSAGGVSTLKPMGYHSSPLAGSVGSGSRISSPEATLNL